MKLRTFRTFQAMILTGISFFLLSRFVSGQLLVYIHQRSIWSVLLAVVVLLVIANTLFRRRSHQWVEESGLLIEKEAPTNAHWQLLLMVIPLVFGIIIPINPLDAEVAASRRVRQSLTFSTDPNRSENILSLEPGTRSILEWLWTIDITEDKKQLEGQPINVEGFVILDESLPEGQFLIARFVITCCVADAIPVGMPVDPGNSDTPITEGWVRVRGHIKTALSGGEASVLIKAVDITPIDRPEQPYLYQ